ncbi:MAG: glycosyltransferase, partial [Betaproteobacteria bacterium]|nr:glycosyltransferase [Betaproteobacteria bacterium]
MVTEAEFKPTVVAGLLSVVIPFYNEEAIAFEACRELIDHLTANAQPWELILVDDGSSDRTLHELARAIQQAPQARILQLSKNFKQTAALQAGIDATRGEFIATLDGDMQNDPRDILPMLALLRHEGLDLVAGWRERRQDHRSQGRYAGLAAIPGHPQHQRRHRR